MLRDFADHVVGRLSDEFATVAAKGGAFFRQKEAEQTKGAERYQRDQTMRAHLINGMLPVLHIARHLRDWGADRMEYYTEETERLFIAGFMLHDYTKIPAVQEYLKKAGFKEMEAPSREKIPILEGIVADWCKKLGLSAFLQRIGGTQHYLQDLLYVIHNTQALWGTIHIPDLLPHVASGY